MKMFTVLVSLLLVSSVGCGQQNASSPEPAAESAAAVDETAAPVSDASAPTAPSMAGTTSDNNVASGEDLEGLSEDEAEAPKSSAEEAARIRLAQAVAPPAPQAASRWKEGKNYHPLVPAQPTATTPDKVEVVEVFWYGCTHCYSLDPYLENWLPKKASYIQFTRVPVTWGPVHRTHARLFYTLEALGRSDLHGAIFREVQIAKNFLADADDAKSEQLQVDFAKRNGIDEKKFREAYHSSAVDSKVEHAQDLVRRYRAESVPMIIVNGKYTSDVTSAGGRSQLITLIDDLAAQEQKK